MEVTLMSC